MPSSRTGPIKILFFEFGAKFCRCGSAPLSTCVEATNVIFKRVGISTNGTIMEALGPNFFECPGCDTEEVLKKSDD